MGYIFFLSQVHVSKGLTVLQYRPNNADLKTMNMEQVYIVYTYLGDLWAGWAIAHPGFVKSINPVSEEADCAPHITTCPPSFKQLPTSLSLSSLIQQQFNSKLYVACSIKQYKMIMQMLLIASIRTSYIYQNAISARAPLFEYKA